MCARNAAQKATVELREISLQRRSIATIRLKIIGEFTRFHLRVRQLS